MKTTIRSALGFSALLTVAAGSGAAGAQYYGGLNFDLSRYATSASTASAESDTGFFLTNTALDDRRVRYGLRLGYQLSPRFALVSRFSAFDQRDFATPFSRGYGLDIEGRAPVFDKFNVSGSAGFVRMNRDAAFGNGQFPESFSSAGSRAVNAGRLALGLQYQLNRSVGLRFDLEKYRALGGVGIGDLGADHLSLGVMLKF